MQLSREVSVRKKNEDRGHAKPIFVAHISALVSESDKVKAADIERNKKRMIDQGITKAMFDLVVLTLHLSMIKAIFWNIQGALDSDANRYFKMLLRKYKPVLFVIMEPHISGVTADDFVRKSGIEYSYRVEATGYSGAICSRRNRLWNQLRILKPEVPRPWVLGGDFNAICNSMELQGGSQQRDGVSSMFNDFIFDTGLIDMGFSGPQFTWKRDSLSQRLDRCLCNGEWYNEFAKSKVFHLHKLGYDHRPLLLYMRDGINLQTQRPFRYIATWNNHPDFNNLLKSTWLDGRSVSENIADFQGKRREWSLENFSHIDRRKNTLLARIKGIEKALEHSNNSHLEELENDDLNTLKALAVDFFSKLLSSEARQQSEQNQASAFVKFSNQDMQPLLAEISKDEEMITRGGGGRKTEIAQPNLFIKR
ncbi:hypothetical protein GQ457_01G016100 [Hibiscus cannabinus]